TKAPGPAAHTALQHLRDEVRIGANLPHKVLPHVHLNGRISVDPLAHLRIDLVPRPADIRAQITHKGCEVLVQHLATWCPVPRPPHSLALPRFFQREIIAHGGGRPWKAHAAAKTWPLHNHLGHILTHLKPPTACELQVTGEI